MKHLLTKSSKSFNDWGIIRCWRGAFSSPDVLAVAWSSSDTCHIVFFQVGGRLLATDTDLAMQRLVLILAA